MTPDLFNPVAKARRTDPVTSHMAAREATILAETHHRAIMDYLEGISPMSASYEDISRATGIEKHGVGRRLKELVMAGKISPAGHTVLASGRAGMTWRAK